MEMSQAQKTAFENQIKVICEEIMNGAEKEIPNLIVWDKEDIHSEEIQKFYQLKAA